MADWVTISSLATATGTLVLATATFASVRSANRTARAAERSLQAGLRPLLIPSRFDDPHAEGRVHRRSLGRASTAALAQRGSRRRQHLPRDLAAELGQRHRGARPVERLSRRSGTDPDPPADTSDFRRLTRDLYIPADEIGFLAGRDPRSRRARLGRNVDRDQGPPPLITIDLLYGDYEGGQHTISRFAHPPARRRALAGTDGPPLEPRSGRPALNRADPPK